MTRPKDIPVALQSWATGNYSAGPSWGGTAQRSAPGAGFLTPNVTYPAEVANYLHGNAFDGTQAAINMGGQVPALNWGGVVASGGGTGFQMAFSPFDQALYLIQVASTAAFRSFDLGKTWGSTTLSVVSPTLGELAADGAGNVVMAGNGAAVQDGTFTAYGSITWANHTAQINTLGDKAGVVYEPSSGLWVILQGQNTNGFTGWTSSTRAAWTNRGTPGTWGSSALINWPFMGVGNGLVVAAFTSVTGAGGSFRTMLSANGGVTWSNDQAITVNAGINLSGGNQTLTRPTWSAVDGLWYIAANQISGTRRVQVFSSPDAITWTTAVTLTANDIDFSCGLIALGALLVGMGSDGRIYTSFNKGANWWKTGNAYASGSAVGLLMRGAGNGLIGLITGGLTVSSLRFGLPTVPV